MLLVYEYHWGDEPYFGTDHIVFDYDSKEKFVFDVLEKFKNYEWKVMGSDYYKKHEKVNLFSNSTDIDVDKFDIERIECDVYTLQEWSIKNAKDLKL